MPLERCTRVSSTIGGSSTEIEEIIEGELSLTSTSSIKESLAGPSCESNKIISSCSPSSQGGQEAIILRDISPHRVAKKRRSDLVNLSEFPEPSPERSMKQAKNSDYSSPEGYWEHSPSSIINGRLGNVNIGSTLSVLNTEELRENVEGDHPQVKMKQHWPTYGTESERENISLPDYSFDEEALLVSQYVCEQATGEGGSKIFNENSMVRFISNFVSLIIRIFVLLF